ncbi:hypothetical protein QYF36_022846 [Acer negundo]|nr:hypothetical protein QYF36_022846 [Acer negundo]
MASSRRSEPISSNPLAESPFHFFKVILPATLEEKKLDKTKIDDSVEITGFTTPNSPSNSLKDKAVDECRRPSGKMDTVPSHLNKPTLGSVLGINRHGKCGASFETPKFKHPNNPDSSTQNELEEEIEEDTNFYGSASPRKRTMTAVAREREFNAARVFEPVNPFCRVVLRKSYLNRKGCLMYFPSSFAKMHLRGVSEIIKLQTTDGKQRIARCVYRGDSANLTQGCIGGPKTDEQNFVHLDEMKVDNYVEIRSSSKNYTPPSQTSFVQAPGINRSRKCDDPASSTQDEHEEEVKMQFRFDGSDSTMFAFVLFSKAFKWGFRIH